MLMIPKSDIFHTSEQAAVGEEVLKNANVQVTFCEEERGASMLEYALLASLIMVAAIAGVALTGQNLSSSFSAIGSSMN